MNNPSLHCFPFTDSCKLLSEWAVYWQSATALATILFGFFGLYKLFHELRRLREQREKDISDKEVSAKLKRTEFFLGQHRRLFDNAELYSVLCLIDGDDPGLTEPGMWDKKRKFLTFLEEIALLVDSGQIDSDVACYMFGYYAVCIKYGKNFAVGIDTSPVHWKLFYKFAAAAERFRLNYPDGPPHAMSL